MDSIGRQSSPPGPLKVYDYLIDGLGLAVLSHALLPLLLTDETLPAGATPQGNNIMLLANFLTYTLFACRMLFCPPLWSRLRNVLRSDWIFWTPLIALLLIAAISATWSFEPWVSLRRSLALWGTVLVGLYLGLRYPPRQFMLLVFSVSAALSIASFAMVLLWPEKGIMQESALFLDGHVGRWRGIFLHKNQAGSIMLIGIILSSALIAIQGRGRLPAYGLLLLCTFILLATESLTSLIATLAGLVVMMVARALPWGKGGGQALLIGALPVALLLGGLALHQASLQVEAGSSTLPGDSTPTGLATETPPDRAGATPGEIIAAPDTSPAPAPAPAPRDGFKRSSDGTGRLGLWQLAARQLAEQSLRGYGYATFWRTGGPAEELWKHTNWRPPHAHNGWIDLALQLGIPVAALGALWMLWLGVRLLFVCWQSSSGVQRSVSVALLGIFVGLNVINLAETIMFKHHDMLWSLLVAIAVLTSRPAQMAEAS